MDEYQGYEQDVDLTAASADQSARQHFSLSQRFQLSRRLRWVVVSVALSLGFAQSASATIAYVQGNNDDTQSAASAVVVPFTAAQAATDLNVVVVAWNDPSVQVNAVTDTRGNSYVLAVGPVTHAGTYNMTQSIYYAKNIGAATANTVTVTFSATTTYPDIRIAEYGGLDTTNPLDVTASGTGFDAMTDSGSVTTTHATDLLVASNSIDTMTTGPGTGYTQRIISFYSGAILEDRTVTTTGSYNATAPQDGAGAYVMQLVAFKAATDGGTPPPTPVTFTYAYDAHHRLIQATGSDGSEIDYQYDANGNVTAINRK